MRHFLPRNLAVVVAAALLVTTTTCHDTTNLTITAPQMPAPKTDRIVGVTMVDGQVVAFDDRAVLIDPKTKSRATPSALADPNSGVLVVGEVKDRKVEIPLASVQRFHVAQVKGNTAKTIGLVAGIVAAGTIAGVVVANSFSSTKSSATTGGGSTVGSCCPYFYSWDGLRYVFDAEPYAGAITRGLERSGDVVLDHLRAQDGTYRVLMTNERPEIDYTNHVSLRVVDHTAGVRVVPGDDGTLYSVSTPLPPLSARTADGRDLTLWLSATDARVWEPEPPAVDETALRDEIVLTFPKPPDARRAKLVANVGASAWGSVMLEKFVEIRGRQIPDWYAALDGNPAAVAATYQWNLQAELWGLKFDVEDPSGWQTRGALLGAGPLVVKDRVVPLDVSRVPGDVLRIRIRPPKGYWALNSFAVDYSTDEPLSVADVPLLSAIDAEGTDRRPALQAADGTYDVMPPGSGPVTLTFQVPKARAEATRTVVLHATGYYRYDLPAGGEPDGEAIRRFETEPDFGVRFAAERYARWRSGERGVPPREH